MWSKGWCLKLGKFASMAFNFIKKSMSSKKDDSGGNSIINTVMGFMKGPTDSLKKLLIVIGGGVAIVVLFIAMISSGLQPKKDDSDNDNPPAVCQTNTDGTGGPGASGGNLGDWTKSGTKANKNAKMVFDAWVSKGYSAAAASAVVGNVSVEDLTFDPAQAEGAPYDGSHTMMDTGPTVMYGTGNGGGGLYQFTPYEKYAPLGDKKWLDIQAQTDFMYKTNAAMWNPTISVMTDIAKATEAFMVDAEGAGDTSSLSKRIAGAEKAYEMWGKDAPQEGKPQDESSNKGSSTPIGNANGSANNNKDSNEAAASNDCTNQNSGEVGDVVKLFDDKYQGFRLGSGLDDPDHTFVNALNGGPGVHGPGAHDGWDIDPLTDPSGSEHEKIYAISGGKIIGVGRGHDASMETYVLIQLSNGMHLQYQEFEEGSIPDNLKAGDTIKAGDLIGYIGDAGDAGGVHYGRYLHITYADKDAPHTPNWGISSFGSTTHTHSIGELLGIDADQWVTGGKSYKWSDMKNLGKSGDDSKSDDKSTDEPNKDSSSAKDSSK